MSVHALYLVCRNAAHNVRGFPIKLSFLLPATTALLRSARRQRLDWRQAMRRLQALLSLGALLLAGCAPTLTPSKRAWMLEQYAAWAPDVAFYAPIALLDDLKNVRDGGAFHGHHMVTYIARIAQPRTKPWSYTAVDAKLCSGR